MFVELANAIISQLANDFFTNLGLFDWGVETD